MKNLTKVAVASVAFLLASLPALACPQMFHEVCIPLTGTCFCSVNVTVGAVGSAGKHEVGPPFSRDGNVTDIAANSSKSGVVQMCYFAAKSLSEVGTQKSDNCVWFEVNQSNAAAQ